MKVMTSAPLFSTLSVEKLCVNLFGRSLKHPLLALPFVVALSLAGTFNASAASFTKLIAPTERSFSVELPDGWNNQLGLKRSSGDYKMPRSWITSRSPDGATQLFIGDLEVPMFQTQLPPEAQAAGPAAMQFVRNYLRKEGIAIKPYLNARQFGAEYTQRRFGQQPGFRILDMTENQPLKQAAAALDQRLGNPSRPLDTVTVNFEYAGHKGQVWVASGYASGAPNIWSADVSGFTTTDKIETGKKLFAQSALSFDISPKWMAREQQQMQQREMAVQQRMQMQRQNMQAQRQQMNQGHQQRMQALQNNFNSHQRRMQQRSAAMDQQHQSWMNTQNQNYEQHQSFVRGIHDQTLVNSGGSSWEVDAGANNYYVDPNSNTYFGTDQPLDQGQIPDGYQEATESNW